VSSPSGRPVASVLVLPGNPGVASYYSDFAAAVSLAASVDVTVCGLRGHLLARSHETFATFSLAQQEAAIVAFIDELPAAATPLVVCGHSIGAYLALRAAAARPERVAGLLGLFPFVQINRGSRLQWLLGVLVRLRPLALLVAAAAAVYSVLPRSVRRALIHWPCQAAGLEEAAIHVTADWCVRFEGVNVAGLL